MPDSLTLEDQLMWVRRTPCASYWLGVSDTHPFIHGHYQPTPTRSIQPPTGAPPGPLSGPPTGPPTGPPPPYVLPQSLPLPHHLYHPGLLVQGLFTNGGQAMFHSHPGFPVLTSVTGGGQAMFHHPGLTIGNGPEQVPLYDVRSQNQESWPPSNQNVSVPRK